jgi:hypothetical protein
LIEEMDQKRYNFTKTEINSLPLQLHDELQLDDNQYTLGCGAGGSGRNQAPEADEQAQNEGSRKYQPGVPNFVDRAAGDNQNYYDEEDLDGERTGDNSDDERELDQARQEARQERKANKSRYDKMCDKHGRVTF